MLFAYNQLVDVKLNPAYRAAWQGTGTSWNYDEITAPFKKDGKTVTPSTMARIADVTLRQADELVGKLGNPIGIHSYKPSHSRGEGFLQNYLGMIGLPMDMYPTFAESGKKVLLLTAQAADDKYIVTKMKKAIREGTDIVITTGLLKAIPEKIAEICELECKDLKAIVNDFGRFGQSSRDIIIPQVDYYTNDSWEIISAGRPLTGGVSGYPILHRAIYSQANLYILTIPDDFGDLYYYPEGALNEIRRTLSKDLDFYIEGPSKVSLFLYDNKTLVVENFNDEPVEIKLVSNSDFKELKDLIGKDNLKIEKVETRSFRSSSTSYKATLTLKPHSYKAYSYK